MKITDPLLCPDGFGPLRFRRPYEDTRPTDSFVLTAGGAAVAELTPLADDGGLIVLDQQQDCVLPCAGCWSLNLIWSLGETHVLCPAQPIEPGSPGLAGEVAAWAVLTVLWGTSSRTPQRG